MKNRNIRAGSVGFLLVLAVVAIWAGNRGDRPATEADLTVQPVPQSAMMTYIDPVTGERVAAPSGDGTSALGEAAATSFDDLELRQSPVPGGGEGFDTNGHFQNAVIVTVDGETATTECVPAEKAAAGGER